MPKPIPRQLHGFADYAYAPTIGAAPELFGFADEPAAKALCRTIAGTVLGSTLFTRAEWGLVRVIPMKAHLTLDVAAGAFVMAAPWLFGFAKNTRARNAFLAFGAVSVVAGSLTQDEEMP